MGAPCYFSLRERCIMSIKVLFCDVDSSLVPEESEPWDWSLFAKLAEMIRETGRNGKLRIGLCTGRPQPYVEALMKTLGITLPAVCENGAVLYDLHTNRAEFGPGVTSSKIHALNRLKSMLIDRLPREFPEIIYQVGKEAQLSLYCARPERLDAVMSLISHFAEQDPELDVTLAKTNYYLNIDLRGVNKGSGLRAVLARLGIAREEAAFLGDSSGDLTARDAAALFTCPSNATDAVKAVADYVSPYPVTAGALDIIRYLAGS